MKNRSAVADLLGYRGVVGKQNADESVTNLYDVLSFRPDPEQPRKLLTSQLYQRLFEGEQPVDILSEWVAIGESRSVSQGQRYAVEALKELAETIRQHGLIHPITFRIYPDSLSALIGVDKLIVTGERRWWAHIYLLLKKQTIRNTQEPSKVRAIQLAADSQIRAVQLIENLSREGLNAVERAEGLFALRDEMSQGRAKAVPWTQVERALGIDRTYRWRIQQVMNLSTDVRELVAEHNLSENAIRPIATNKELKNKPDIQLLAIQQLLAWLQNDEDSSAKRLEKYVSILLQQKQPASISIAPPTRTLNAPAIYKRANTTLKALSKLDSKAVEQMQLLIAQDTKAAAPLFELRDKLNSLLADLD